MNAKKTYVVDTKGKIEKVTFLIITKKTFLAFFSFIYQIVYFFKLPLIFLKHNKKQKIFSSKNISKKNLRIAYLRTNDTYNLKSGGSLGHTLGVINSFSKAVQKVDFFGIDELAGLKPNIQQTIFKQNKFLNYVNVSNRFITSNRLVSELKSYFFVEKYNLIYQRLSRDDISGALLSKIFNIPLIVEYNSSMKWEVTNSSFIVEKFFLRITEALEKFVLNQAFSIISVSEVLKDELSKRGYKDNVYVVTNGVDLDSFVTKHSNPKKSFCDDNTKIVCFSGTFGFWHGIDIMEEAIKIINKEKEKCHFLLIGDGFYRKEIEQGLKEYNNITFTGNINFEEMSLYLSMADIFLSPHSLKKDKSFIGSPTKLFEYMAFGKIIIGSDLDQISNIISPSLKLIKDSDFNKSVKLNEKLVGILTKAGDAQLLAMSIKYALKNFSSLEFMGENAKNKVNEKYTWDIKVNEILQTLYISNEK